jgi:hypothetical protein
LFFPSFFWYFWLLVNDSEYSKSTDTKSILSPGCIYLVSPGARCFCCCASCGFMLLLLRAPTPPRPPFGGKYQKRKSPVASGMAFGHVCVGVGVVGAPRWVSMGIGVTRGIIEGPAGAEVANLSFPLHPRMRLRLVARWFRGATVGLITGEGCLVEGGAFYCAGVIIGGCARGCCRAGGEVCSAVSSV